MAPMIRVAPALSEYAARHASHGVLPVR